MKKIILLALTGAFAGAVNGLFGTGGGTVTVLALTALLSRENNGENLTKKIFATTNALIIVLCTVSILSLYLIGSEKAFGADLDFPVVRMLPAALIGSAAGVLLLGKINPTLLKIIFGAMIIYCGVRMIFC